MEGKVGARPETEEVPVVAEPPSELRGARVPPTEEVEGRAAIRKLADDRTVTADEADAATEWFLADEEPADTDTFELNVGSPDVPRWISWTVRAVDQEVLRRLTRDGGRATRRRGQSGVPDIDPQEANAKIVVEATVAPDLAEIARVKGVQQTADPLFAQVQVVKHRFRHKPGLIDQIAGRVMDLSGYNEDDVREAIAAKN